MSIVQFPYGKEKITYDFSGERLLDVLVSGLHDYTPEADGETLVRRAMEMPYGSPRLSELAVGKRKIVIIASDHTRPVPSRVIIPPMLEEIRTVNPEAEITILIATGCHRETKREELIGKFGEEIVQNERIVIHDCTDDANLVNIGTLPSGGELWINRLAYEADLLISEGFIEPHFFAGFSGGRKSVLPGIAGRATVLANHCSEFIAHPNARTGILEGNPVHEDMLWAASTAKLQYIVNVVLNDKKEVIYATAGDTREAHRAGTDFLSSLCTVKAQKADVAITTNGGYPLDQNVYQAVKGMTAAEASVKQGGVIIMLSRSDDGTGGEHFYHQLADEADLGRIMTGFLNRARNETLPDQWQSQILVRILMHAHVVFISSLDDKTVEELHMIPAHSIDEALEIARGLVGKQDLTVTAIPDGISVIVR